MKILKYFKKHKLTAIIIVIFIILAIVLFYLWNLFFIKGDTPKYGDRLDGIEEVEIKKDKLKELETKTKESESVKEVSSNISGRILDIVITVEDNVSIGDAKKIAAESYALLDEKQINYYSIQVFVKKNDASLNNFPIIGYKQKGTKDLIWTKDRAVTKPDETK